MSMQIGPTPLGYNNKLVPAHPIALALNPTGQHFGFSEILRENYATIRDEYLSRREQTLRPRKDFVSVDFKGAISNASETVGWSSVYLRQRARLRVAARTPSSQLCVQSQGVPQSVRIVRCVLWRLL